AHLLQVARLPRCRAALRPVSRAPRVSQAVTWPGARGGPMTPEECLVIYGEAWFERDAARRVEVLRRCCTEDIVFMDPSLGRLNGLEAVSEMIGGYIGSMSASAPDDAPKANTAEPRGRSGGGVSV